jgi:hypothetical protein
MNRNKKESKGASLNVKIFCLVMAAIMIFGVVAGALAMVL